MGRLSEIVQRAGVLSARPSAAVARGLRRFRFGRALVHVVEQCIDGPLLHYASAMAFDLFLGSIPLLALAGWLFGRLLLDDSALRAVSLLLGSTPVQVQSLAKDELTRYSADMLAPLAIAGALWLGSSACVTCLQYLEEREPETRRSWWKRRIWALVWVTGSVLVFGIGSALVFSFVGGPIRLLESLVSQESAARTSYLLALALLYGLALLMLAGFYRIVLHARTGGHGVFVGAALAIGISGLTSFVFAVYVARLASYALYYGSLAAVAITMVWLWLLCLFVLSGAEFLVSYDERNRAAGSLDSRR